MNHKVPESNAELYVFVLTKYSHKQFAIANSHGLFSLHDIPALMAIMVPPEATSRFFWTDSTDGLLRLIEDVMNVETWALPMQTF